MLESLLASIVLFLAAFIHGLAGFAFALFAVPLLSLFWPLKEVVPLMALLGFIVNAVLLASLKKYFQVYRVFSLSVGAIPGVIIGAIFLSKAPEIQLKIILGITLIGYGSWGLINLRPKIILSEKWGYIFGFLAGALGAALNTPGPPVVVYVTLKGWPKDEVKSTLQGYFLILLVGIIMAHLSKGLITRQTFIRFLEFCPAVLIGIFLGHSLYHRLTIGVYFRILYLLLILTGLLAFIP